jgi:hypothetical protein
MLCADFSKALICSKLQGAPFLIGTERRLSKLRLYDLVFLHARRKTFPAFAAIAAAVAKIWLTGEVTAVCEVHLTSAREAF